MSNLSKALRQTRESAAMVSPVPVAGPTLKADGSSRFAGSLLRSRTSVLFRHLPLALTGDEEAIHQLRVSGRRLRVALPLLTAKPDGRRVARAKRLLRQLTRLAGSSRDLDVLLASYDERLKELTSRTPEQQILRHRLTDARRRSRGRMVDGLLDLEISRLRGDLSGLVRRGGPAPSIVCERFASTSARELHALGEELKKIGPRLDAQELHAFRRRARRLRYAIEVFDEIRNFKSTASKPWKTLQDLIGVIHDHQVLAEWFDAQAKNDDRHGKGALAAAAREEATWAISTMHRLHAQFLAANPTALVAQGLAALGQSHHPE